MSVLALGLAAVGRPGYINLGHSEDLGAETSVNAMEDHCHEVLDAAFALGIRWFDAARSYGRAEAFLSSWLGSREIAPPQVAVSSKRGYVYTAGWRTDAEVNEVKDHSLRNLQRQWDESYVLLGSHLKLYQIHSATLVSGVLDDGAVLDQLARLRDTGMRIGVTLSGPDQAEVCRRALDVERGGTPLFATVQATWNLLERSAGPALAAAHEARRVVLVKEVLANGRLTRRGDVKPLLDAAAEREVTPDALATAAALAQPWASVVVLGAATVDQVRSNVAAVDVKWDADLEERLARVAEPSATYWAERSQLPWT